MKNIAKQKILFLIMLLMLVVQPMAAFDEGDSSPDPVDAPLNPEAPIDDYIPLLILGAAILGFYFIPRKTAIKKV